MDVLSRKKHCVTVTGSALASMKQMQGKQTHPKALTRLKKRRQPGRALAFI